jgi:hypothetical protein
MTNAPPLPAGEFAAWLDGIRAALRGDLDAAMPCGTCVGCCVSRYHVTLRPEDAAARARVPPEFLVESPALPPGHVLMRHDVHGRCPMLRDGACTIYAVRPRTCRTYDCRVLAAAGIPAGGPDKAVIDERVRRWRFDYAGEDARRTHAAVRAAAQFIRNDATSFPPVRAPVRPNDVAVVAIQAHELFLGGALPESRAAKGALAARVLAAAAECDAPAGHGAGATG